MKRRKFIIYSSMAGGVFIANLGLYKPKPANACLICFAFIETGAGLSGLALAGLSLAAFGAAGGSKKTQEWFDRRLEAQLAQREFIQHQFTNITVADVAHSEYGYIIGAEKEESLGYNPALSFPRIQDDEPNLFTASGAASIGMSVAAEYLQQNERLTNEQVQAAILPRISGASTTSDWRTWENSSFPSAYPNAYSDFNGVSIRYDAVDPRSGGFGTIDVRVNAYRVIKIPQIKVNFI